MQSASVNYIGASSGAGGTWADPKLMADWALDGYGTAGTIDDLSTQLGGWTVEHHLDDGYPEAATFIAGVAVAQLSADLGPPPAYLTGNVPMQVAEVYSPYNTSSPLSGFDRDVAPVKLDHGVITSAGPERIRIFTGQMLDIPVKRGKATLSAVSASRMKLATLVQPPAFWGFGRGLNGSWPVSWALATCGVYVSPPPRSGVRYWNPLHGSTTPFIPASNPLQVLQDDTGSTTPTYNAVSVGTDGNPVLFTPDDWTIDAPYFLAPGDLQLLTAESRRITIANLQFDDGDDFLSTAGNKARCEFWVRGDATNFNTAPGGSGTVSRLCGFRFQNTAVTRAAYLEVDTSRRVAVTVIDGAGHTATLTSDDTLPTDGAWYFVGAAYDVTAKKLWLTNFSGTTKSASAASLVTSSLPAADIWAFSYPNFVSYLPCAEMHLTTGAQANVDNFPTWLNGVAFTPSARLARSNLRLEVLAETQPREAWEFISGFAQAELAAMRTDELDVVNYLTPGWWVRAEQQVVAEVVSTETNAGAVDINIDPTKIRNTARVSYGLVEVAAFGDVAYSLSQQLTIPPGVTTYRFVHATPIISPIFVDIALADDVTLAPSGMYPSDYVALNTASDGTGTFATPADVTVTRTAWDAGATEWTFTNNVPTTWYTANGVNKPSLQIIAQTARTTQDSATEADTASVAARGERSLSVQAPSVLQTRLDARRLAGLLKMGLRDPVPIVEGLELFGEARRQPGDLIEFEDPSITRVSGQWRYQTITHQYDTDGAYTQPVRIRPVLQIGVWGTSTWGDVLWGPREI